MPRVPKNSSTPDDLPVLTELSDTGATIPVLTRAVGREIGVVAAKEAAQLSDAQCRELAAQIAPILEAMLREKLASQFEALWQESWRQVEENLPELIRDKLTARPRRSPK